MCANLSQLMHFRMALSAHEKTEGMGCSIEPLHPHYKQANLFGFSHGHWLTWQIEDTGEMVSLPYL